MWRWLLFALVLPACGPADVCSRAEQINVEYRERHAACIAGDPFPGTPFDVAACTDAIKTCSAADERTLQRYFDCVEALPPCTPDTRSDFQAAFLACANGMATLSSGCAVP